jgi:protein gp37
VADTEIEWATKVWNFTRGCRRVSTGCGGANGRGGCYAEKTAYRFSGPGQPYEGLVRLGKHGPQWTGKGRFVGDKLDEPLRWRAPRDGSRHRIFVNSMSDLFFEEFSNEEIASGFGVMAACPQHDFLILTKRPKRAVEWFKWVAAECAKHQGCERDTLHHALYPRLPDDTRGYDGPRWQPTFFEQYDVHAASPGSPGEQWPLPNVWLGVSVENQETADDRVSLLLERIPAAVRFASYEPALGDVSFWAFLKGEVRDRCVTTLGGKPTPGLDWVIVGGESGPGAREFDLDWARDAIRQCAAARVPCFVKQLGARPLDGEHGAEECRVPVKLSDRKGGDPAEWPPDLRVRQFPETP